MGTLEVIKPAVCIPIHTSSLNRHEIISIKSHISKLQAHDVFLLVPSSKINSIIEILENNEIPRKTYKIHQLEDIFLNHSDNYQLLLLSTEFYSFYKNYTHILIAQMDAYTFSDQLLHWCNKEWDYIGAPLYYKEQDRVNDFFCCGVGGFSLRSIKKTLEVLEINPTIYQFDDFKKEAKSYNFKGKFILFLKYLVTKLLKKDKLRRSIIKSKLHKFSRRFYIFINEDISYSYYLPKYLDSFKVADFDDSIKFSIDCHVNESLEILNFVLPFGAHSWFTNHKNLIAWGKYIY